LGGKQKLGKQPGEVAGRLHGPRKAEIWDYGTVGKAEIGKAESRKQKVESRNQDDGTTGKERAEGRRTPAPGRALNPQAGMEHLQAQVLLQAAGGKVLMLGVRAGTIPRP